MVTVRAPATSADLKSGLDVFGVALDRPTDIVHVERMDRTTIEVTGVGNQYILANPDRNVVDAITGTPDVPVHTRISRSVRPPSDLGSSTANSAVAVVVLNELYDRGLSREKLIPVAAEGEAVVSGEVHTDNVVSALPGGFTVATDEGVTAVDANIPLVACLPEIAVSIRDVHHVVPSNTNIEGMVYTVGRTATLAVGTCRRDADLIDTGMDSRVVTPVQAKLINGYHDAREAALAAGAASVTVSGADSSVLGVYQTADRTRVAGTMLKAFDETDVAARAYKTRVGRGAEVFES